VRRAAEVALVAVAVAALVAGRAPAANALPQPAWGKRVHAAERYARARAGLVSFALIDETGGWHGYRAGAVAPTASLLKAMLLVAYLRMAPCGTGT
jgi:beta-lactamase class A